MTEKRLELINIVDCKNRSRQKGFELFRFFQILTQKKQVLGEKFQEAEQHRLEESLVESYILLKDDVNCPPPLHFCYDKLVSTLGSDQQLQTLRQKILRNYNT